MDSVEKRISEKLGFWIERIDFNGNIAAVRHAKGEILPIVAHPDAVALWDALLASERRREWVKVSEHPPEKDGRYLVVRYGVIEFNHWSCRERGWTLRIPVERTEIKYYQPLPALPSEANADGKKLRADSRECPYCGVNFIYTVDGKEYSIAIAVYDQQADRTTHFKCPHCGRTDERW